MKIVTHNGHFHTDDLLAVAALLIKYPEAEVVRTRDEEVIASADIVVDVGLVYDPVNFRFDHHQKGGAGERENGVGYASIGLVWKMYGEELAGGVEEAKLVDERLIVPVDSNDNAVPISVPLKVGVREYTLHEFFGSFTQDAHTMEEFDKAFATALVVAKDLLKREIASAQHAVASWKEIRRIYAESEDKKIVVIPSDLRWSRALIPTEALFVIFQRPDGRWTVRGVPVDIEAFGVKKPFPATWGGLGEKSLQEISEVETAVFCHINRHLAVTDTKEDALKLAQIALNS